jgi:AhpD family alkylhydroperoxidase
VTLTAEYDRLFIDKQSPAAYRAMSAVTGEVAATAEAAGLDRLLVELVNIRVSQLNGCGFCLDLHVRRAVKNGETPQRLAVLPAWRDVDLFSPTEQAALALAEAITTLPEHHERERERIRARKAADRRPVLGGQLDRHHNERVQPDLHHQRAPGPTEKHVMGWSARGIAPVRAAAGRSRPAPRGRETRQCSPSGSSPWTRR